MAQQIRGRGCRERTIRWTARVPIGIEKVVYLAATQPAFRRALLDDRARALEGSGVSLTDVERATLVSVPRAALETMIGRVHPDRHGKRRLMKTVAAATVSLAAGVAGAASEGCGEDDTGDAADVAVPDMVAEGEAPDVWNEDAPSPDRRDADAADGADVDVHEMGGDGGIDPGTWYEDAWTPGDAADVTPTDAERDEPGPDAET